MSITNLYQFFFIVKFYKQTSDMDIESINKHIGQIRELLEKINDIRVKEKNVTVDKCDTYQNNDDEFVSISLMDLNNEYAISNPDN